MKLTLDQAEELVKKSEGRFFWDNYTLNKFEVDPFAEFNPKGSRHKNEWGFLTSYEVDQNGEWTVL